MAAREIRSGTTRGRPATPPTAEPARVDRPVVGPVPPVARACGLLLLLSGAAGGLASLLPYLVVGGRDLWLASGTVGILAALLAPVANLALGAVLLRGTLPKLGLAYAGVGGALAVGQLLIEVYRGRASTARPAVEVLAGQRVLTSSVEVRPGWALTVAALTLAVLGGLCGLIAWGRTVMDDDDGGSLDALRPALAAAAVLLGVTTVLCLVLPAADVPDRVLTDPSTGLQTVVAEEGPQGLLERPGLALLGGLLLAGAVVLCSVVAPSLRPRAAAVGGLLAVAVTVLAAGMSGLRDATSSPDLEWTLPGAGLLAAGLGYALLTVLAWRARRNAVVAGGPDRP